MTPQELRERLDRLGLELVRHRRLWVVVKPYRGARVVKATFETLGAIPAWLRTYQ